MDSLGSLRQKCVSDLSSIYDQDEAMSLFQIAAEHLLGYSRVQLSMKEQENISEEHEAKYNSQLQQLQTGRPTRQIIRKTPFYGMEFILSEDTLIPCPEPEELVYL